MNRIFLLFLLIFLLSTTFRITNLDLIEFKTDEAVNLLLASRPLFGYSFPYGGTVSSLGILNPPLFNYILFPIVAINLDPKFVSFTIALINSFSVAFFFLIVRRFYGLSIALISSTLFALSPWAILYSRKIWMQDLLIPFFLIVFYSVHKLILDKKSIYWLPYTFASLILIQLHQASLIFVAILTLFLLRTVKLNFKYIFWGIIIGLLPLFPYAIYQFNNACPDCQSFFEARNRLSPKFSPEVFLRPLQILNQGSFRFIMGNDTLTFSQNFPFIDLIRKISYLEYILLPIGVLLFIKRFKTFRFFAFAAIFLSLLYFILRFEPFMHYYIIILPLLFLFLGVALNFFILNKNLILKNLGFSVLLSLILVSFLFNFFFFRHLREKGSFEGDYGTAFYVSSKERNERITNLKDISNKEAFLESFIPLNYAFGFQPLGKMLYGDLKEEEIPFLEEKLTKEVENQKVKHQLLAYHTKNELSLETVDFLRKKVSEIPRYESLYKEVYQYYLSSNFKKEYTHRAFGLRFFYPEHWEVKELKDGIIISGDGYGLIIYQKESEIGNIFKTGKLNFASIKVGYFEEKESKGKDRERRVETIKDISDSIRPL